MDSCAHGHSLTYACPYCDLVAENEKLRAACAQHNKQFGQASDQYAEMKAANEKLRADLSTLKDMRERWNELVGERDEARHEVDVLAKVGIDLAQQVEKLRAEAEEFDRTCSKVALKALNEQNEKLRAANTKLMDDNQDHASSVCRLAMEIEKLRAALRVPPLVMNWARVINHDEEPMEGAEDDRVADWILSLGEAKDDS